MRNAYALGVWQLLVVVARGNAYALIAYGGQQRGRERALL
jgi:hypothetical protein